MDDFFERGDSLYPGERLKPHLRSQLVNTLLSEKGGVNTENLRNYAFKAWKQLLEFGFAERRVKNYFDLTKRASIVISKVCKSWNTNIEGYKHTTTKREALDKITKGKTPGLRGGSNGTLVTLNFTTDLRDAVRALPQYKDLESAYSTEKALGCEVHRLIAEFHHVMGSRPSKVDSKTSSEVANQEVYYYLLDSDTQESTEMLKGMTLGYSDDEKAVAKYLGNYYLYEKILLGKFKTEVLQPAKVSNYIAGVTANAPDAGDYKKVVEGVTPANVAVLNHIACNSDDINYNDISQLKHGLLNIIDSNDFKVRAAAQPDHSQPFDVAAFNATVISEQPSSAETLPTAETLGGFKDFLNRLDSKITVSVTADEIKGYFTTFITDYVPTEKIAVAELILPSSPASVLHDNVFKELGIKEDYRQLWDEYLHANFSAGKLNGFQGLAEPNPELMEAKEKFDRNAQIQAAIKTMTDLRSDMTEGALMNACTIKNTYSALFNDENPLQSTTQKRSDQKKISTHLAVTRITERNTLAKLYYQRAFQFPIRHRAEPFEMYDEPGAGAESPGGEAAQEGGTAE